MTFFYALIAATWLFVVGLVQPPITPICAAGAPDSHVCLGVNVSDAIELKRLPPPPLSSQQLFYTSTGVSGAVAPTLRSSRIEAAGKIAATLHPDGHVTCNKITKEDFWGLVRLGDQAWFYIALCGRKGIAP